MLLLFFLVSFVSTSILPIQRAPLSYIRNLSSETDFVYGNSTDLQYYYTELEFGEPPSKQALIVDTGSSITCIPCAKQCEHCGKHLDEKYKLEGLKLNRLKDSANRDLFIFLLYHVLQLFLQLQETV